MRKLTLRAEPLTELTPADLRVIDGGAVTSPARGCLVEAASRLRTCLESILQPCISNGCTR